MRSQYGYYNFQMTPEDKERQQALAQDQQQTLSSLLLDYVHACDLVRQAAAAGGQVKIAVDGNRINVAYNGTVVKI